MADAKISALTNLTAADAINDMIPIVDVSDTPPASGNTKRISINNILGASGVATLASATITGAATVGTTLGVTGNLTVAGSGPHRFGTTNYAQLDQASLQFVGSRSTPGPLTIYSNGSRLVFQCDTVGYLFQNANNTLTLLGITNDATQLTVNSTGLGVGVSPATKFHISGTGTQTAKIQTNTSGDPTLLLEAAGANSGLVIYNRSLQAIQLGANGSAGQVTLDSLGNLLVGTSSSASSSGSGFKVTNPIAGHFNPFVVTSANSSIYSCWDIYSTGGTAGYRFFVTSTGTVNAISATISAISDGRLKENVKDIDVGLSAILALKPRTFDWKAGKGKGIKGDRGFIAQEFETVFPDLIDEWKDAAPEGEAPYKSVRQDLIPVLVKAIQELTARVQTLEAR
jgi:hypothetical protein